MSEEQATAVDSGVAELTSDFLPSSQPEPQASEPAQAQSQEPAATAAEATPTQGSAQAPTPTSAQQTFRYQGLTPEQVAAKLTSDPEFARAMMTRAEQTAYYQQQVEYARQQMAALHQAQQAQAQQAQQAPQAQQAGQWPVVDQLKAMYAPTIKQAVAQGLVEEDIAAAYPNLTANLFYAVDQLADARQAIQILTDRMNRTERGSVETQVRSELDSMIGGLTQYGGHFAKLTDPQEQEAFRNYLIQVNPMVGQLRDPKFMGAMYTGFRQEEAALAFSEVEKLRAERAEAEKTKRRQAQGAGTGTRPGAVVQQAPTGFDDADLLDEYPHLRAQAR